MQSSADEDEPVETSTGQIQFTKTFLNKFNKTSRVAEKFWDCQEKLVNFVWFLISVAQ